MSDQLKYKPDWPKAQQRWTAFWELAETDRPCIDVKAPLATDVPPPARPASLEDLYFDPDYVAVQWRHLFATTYFGGEAVPTGGFFMGGYALGCGPDVVLTPNTVWHPVTTRSIRGKVNWRPGPDDPWQQKLDRIIDRLLDESQRKFLVGLATQVMANDLLALLRGSQDFLTDLTDDLGNCVRRLEEILPPWIGIVEHYRRKIAARQNAGCVWGWPGLWHSDFLMIAQSDMSCMISEAMFDRYVMRDIDALGEKFRRVWYHVDGPGAIRHVPRLLKSSCIRAIEYVAGDGQPPNGPDYLDLYRQVQSAGRCLDLDAPMGNMEYLVRHLRPEGLVLRTWAPSREQADELLDKAKKWAGTHAGTG